MSLKHLQECLARVFKKYLQDIYCLFKIRIQQEQEATDWLLSLAIRLE